MDWNLGRRARALMLLTTYPRYGAWLTFEPCIYRGYYTAVRRYEFYLRVVKTIFYGWAQRMSKISFHHEKIKFRSSNWLVIFFLLYSLTNYLGINLVFSSNIFILSTKTCCFSIEQKTKMGSPLLDKRRHFENKFLALWKSGLSSVLVTI
jgi:hypothetical protein